MPSNAFQDDFWPVGPFRYQRHQPENTLLYQRVKEHWPQFQNMRSGQGRHLPDYMTREFEDYLKCGRLEHGFLRVRCESCHHEKLVAFSCKRRGFCIQVEELVQHSHAGKDKAYSMIWAQRLKRVFSIEIEKCDKKCDKCGGKVKIIAAIEDPGVIEKTV